MNQENPLVSVIIPAYNRADTLKRTIDSVLKQTYKNIEIIVVDDGSTDNTKKVAKKFGKKILYFYKKNGGCASALNHGLKNSKGELIAWLSSDDYYENEMIKKSVTLHLQKPDLGMTYTRYYINNLDGTKKPYLSYQPTGRKDALEQCFKICYINGSSIMVKKKVFYKIGFFNENFKYAQDYEFYFRVLSQYDIELIEDYLLQYTDHTGEEDPNWLGYNIIKGVHNNESDVVLERFKLMFEKNRPTVCAMICVKNEEDLIDGCINDLSMYVDKIVVFDDGSTDNTPELIRQWGKVAYVLRQLPKGNVRTEGKDREKLLQLAYSTNCDFFLFIDTDEVFEDTYKTTIFKEMKNPIVNLWFYHEVNFWRSEEYYRIDTLYNDGWFGRLFRNSPGLKIVDLNEHCCGIPNNIPRTNAWFQNQETQGKSSVRVKHYGFSTEKRILDKFRGLWDRDPLPLPKRFETYGRLIDETNLTLRLYQPKKYYVEEKFSEEKITGAKFGISKALSKEMKKINGTTIPPVTFFKPIKMNKAKPEAIKKLATKIEVRIGLPPEISKKQYLIIGNGNCFRSQYLEMLLKEKGLSVESCGLNPGIVHPEVIKIFKEKGVNLKYLTTPTHIDQIDVNSFKKVISLVDISNLDISVDILKWAVPDGNIDDMEQIDDILDLIKEQVEKL